MNTGHQADERRFGRRFLEQWASHLVHPGELTVLTARAGAFGLCGRTGQEPRIESEPMVHGFAFRPEHDLFAVGRGVGAVEGEVTTGWWTLAIGLHEVAEAFGRGDEEAESAARHAAGAVANRMREAARADAIFENAGCAVTALWLGGGRPVLIHAGDCAAVRLRRGFVEALTVEHTLERDSRDKGIPIASPYIRSVLLRLLGAFESPRGDPQVLVPDLVAEDRVVLMTNDVAARLSNVDFAAAVDGTPADAGRRLVNVAFGRKAREAAVAVIDLG